MAKKENKLLCSNSNRFVILESSDLRDENDGGFPSRMVVWFETLQKTLAFLLAASSA